MPEFRQDPLSGRWVIIAEDRSGRPNEFASPPPHRALERCPFCAGSEQDTPDAIAVYSGESPSDGTWKVRVIPNKYPAVVPDAGIAEGIPAPAAANAPTKLANRFAPQPGIGIHEVIVESPQHLASFTELSRELALIALRVYQDRLLWLSQDPQLKYALLFKNCRGGSGATLHHVHSQLLATAIVPTEIDCELQSAARHFEKTGRCVFCELVQQELTSKVRVAHETQQFVALCPYASRFPYETWILPRVHGNRFERADGGMLGDLAGLLQRLLRSFERLSAAAAYNFWIRTAPFQMPCDESFHWRFELIPRVTTQAGYEWGTGCFVNPVAPESAAVWLRDC